MIKIFVLFFILLEFQNAVRAKISAHKPDEIVYIPPCNTKYPYGDEVQFNVNILDNDTNPFPCEEHKNLEQRLGKCPIDMTDDTSLLNPYTDCPDYAVLPSPSDIAQLPAQKPNPEVLCKRCDLKLTADGLGVLLECNHCLDVPSTNRIANTTVKDLLYKVFFVQIANYTSVKVTGSENFDA